MKILFCGETFPKASELLKNLLPEDEVTSCPAGMVSTRGLGADVIVPLMHRLEPDLIAETSARLIHQWGVGLEGVDIKVADARGIAVCNVPGDITANADSTAEHAIFLMLGIARQIHHCFRAFHEGVWGAPIGEALFGNTALIVGLGRVGRALASKLKPLGMTVHAIRRTADPVAERELGLDAVGSPEDLITMAREADFLVSTVVLTDQTRGLFNRTLFEAMKPTAFVINVSRGPVVNEDDLTAALDTGIIAGAGLDVYVTEPLPSSHRFLSMNNVFATPHIGGATRQNYLGIGEVVANNITLFREGKVPLYCVNPGVLDKEGA